MPVTLKLQDHITAVPLTNTCHIVIRYFAQSAA